MTVTMHNPKPLDAFTPPLDNIRFISGFFIIQTIQTLSILWMLLSKKAQKKWMDPLGIHPLKITQNPVARRRFCKNACFLCYFCQTALERCSQFFVADLLLSTILAHLTYRSPAEHLQLSTMLLIRLTEILIESLLQF